MYPRTSNLTVDESGKTQMPPKKTCFHDTIVEVGARNEIHLLDVLFGDITLGLSAIRFSLMEKTGCAPIA